MGPPCLDRLCRGHHRMAHLSHIRLVFASFILTDRRLILSQGIINKSTMPLPLEQLNDVRTSQNAWERIFNYGDV